MGIFEIVRNRSPRTSAMRELAARLHFAGIPYASEASPLSDEDNTEDDDGGDLEMRQGAGGALIASDSIKI